MQFSYGYHNRMRGGYEQPESSQRVSPEDTIGKRIQRGPLRHSIDNRKYEYRGVSVDRMTGQEQDIYRRRNLAFENATRPGDWRPGVVHTLAKFDDARARALWRSQMRNESDGLYSPYDIHRPVSIPYHPTEVRPNHLRQHPIDMDSTDGHAPTNRKNATQYLPKPHCQYQPYAIDRDPYYVYDEHAAIDDRTRPDTPRGRKPRDPFVGQYYGTDEQRNHARTLLRTEYYPTNKATKLGDTHFTSRNRERSSMVDTYPNQNNFAILHPSVHKSQTQELSNSPDSKENVQQHPHDRIPLRVTAHLGQGPISDPRSSRNPSSVNHNTSTGFPVRAAPLHSNPGVHYSDTNDQSYNHNGDTRFYDSLGDGTIQRAEAPYDELRRRPPQAVGHFQPEHVGTRQFTHPNASYNTPSKWRNAKLEGKYAQQTRNKHQLGERQVEHTANPPLAQTNPAINPHSANAAYQAAYYGRETTHAERAQNDYPTPPVNSLTQKSRNESKFVRANDLEKERTYRSYTQRTPKLPTTKDPAFNNPWNLNTFSNKTVHTVEDIQAAPELYHQSHPKRLENRLPHDLGERLDYERSFRHSTAQVARQNFHDPTTWNISIGQDNQPPEFRKLEKITAAIAEADTDPVLPQRASKYEDSLLEDSEYTLPDHVVNAVARHGPKEEAHPENRPSMSHQMANEIAENELHASTFHGGNIWDRMVHTGEGVRQALSDYNHLAQMARIKHMDHYTHHLTDFLQGAMSPTEQQKLEQKIQKLPSNTLASFPAWSLIVQAIEKYGPQHVTQYLDASTRGDVARALHDQVQQYKVFLQQHPSADNASVYEALQNHIRQQQNTPTQSLAKHSGINSMAAYQDPNEYRADLSTFDPQGHKTAHSMLQMAPHWQQQQDGIQASNDTIRAPLTVQQQYHRYHHLSENNTGNTSGTIHALASLLQSYSSRYGQGLPQDLSQFIQGSTYHAKNLSNEGKAYITQQQKPNYTIAQDTAARLKHYTDTGHHQHQGADNIGNILHAPHSLQNDISSRKVTSDTYHDSTQQGYDIAASATRVTSSNDSHNLAELSSGRDMNQKFQQGLHHHDGSHGHEQSVGSTHDVVSRLHANNQDHALANTSNYPISTPSIPFEQRKQLGHELLYTYWSTNPSLQTMYPRLRSFENALKTSPFIQQLVSTHTSKDERRGHPQNGLAKPDIHQTIGQMAAEILRTGPTKRMDTITQDVQAILDLVTPLSQSRTNGDAFKARLSAIEHVMHSPYLQQIMGQALLLQDPTGTETVQHSDRHTMAQPSYTYQQLMNQKAYGHLNDANGSSLWTTPNVRVAQLHKDKDYSIDEEHTDSLGLDMRQREQRKAHLTSSHDTMRNAMHVVGGTHERMTNNIPSGGRGEWFEGDIQRNHPSSQYKLHSSSQDNTMQEGTMHMVGAHERMTNNVPSGEGEWFEGDIQRNHPSSQYKLHSSSRDNTMHEGAMHMVGAHERMTNNVPSGGGEWFEGDIQRNQPSSQYKIHSSSQDNMQGAKHLVGAHKRMSDAPIGGEWLYDDPQHHDTSQYKADPSSSQDSMRDAVHVVGTHKRMSDVPTGDESIYENPKMNADHYKLSPTAEKYTHDSSVRIADSKQSNMSDGSSISQVQDGSGTTLHQRLTNQLYHPNADHDQSHSDNVINTLQTARHQNDQVSMDNALRTTNAGFETHQQQLARRVHGQTSHQADASIARELARNFLLNESAQLTSNMLQQELGTVSGTSDIYKKLSALDQSSQQRVWNTILLPFLQQLQYSQHNTLQSFIGKGDTPLDAAMAAQSPAHKSSYRYTPQLEGHDSTPSAGLMAHLSSKQSSVHELLSGSTPASEASSLSGRTFTQQQSMRALLEQNPTLQSTLQTLAHHPDLIGQGEGTVTFVQDTLDSVGMNMNTHDTPYRRNQTNRTGFGHHSNALWTDDSMQAVARIPKGAEAKHRVNTSVSPWLSNQEHKKVYGTDPGQVRQRVDQSAYDPRLSSYSTSASPGLIRQQQELAQRNVQRTAGTHSRVYAPQHQRRSFIHNHSQIGPKVRNKK